MGGGNSARRPYFIGALLLNQYGAELFFHFFIYYFRAEENWKKPKSIISFPFDLFFIGESNHFESFFFDRRYLGRTFIHQCIVLV